MKIVFDTEANTVKVGRKTFGVDMDKNKEHCVVSYFNKFVKDNTTLNDFDGYEEDSMWMSYRYCIGRHTIASSMRAGDIASHCYGRMSEERSIFTAYDINREIERCLQFGCGPRWCFPITSFNRIYTSALDIFCQFIEDFDIQKKEDLLKYYEVRINLADNERGYTFETITWEELLRPQVHKIVLNTLRYLDGEITEDEAWEYYVAWKENPKDENPLNMDFKRISKNITNPEYFYLTNVDDLMVWNHLVHLFDLEHHHKSILTNGEEVEWFWTYTHDTYQKEGDPDHYYQKEIGYKRIRMPINATIGSITKWIHDENIKEDLY